LDIESEEMFKGKIVSFSSGLDTLGIKNISFKTIQGKKFVIGDIPLSATKGDLALDKACGVSWDSVTDFMVFDTEKEYSDWIEANEI
jgi:hypothetical protein